MHQSSNTIPVYAIPGTMCDERLWQTLQRDTDTLDIIHVPVPNESTLDNIVASLQQQLPEKPFNLLGFSMGAYIASALCVKHPTRVKRLSVLSNSPSVLPEEELRQRQQALRWVEKHGYTGMSAQKVKAMLHRDNRDNKPIIEQVLAMDKACGEAVLVQQLTATSARTNLAPALAQLPTPMQFLFGDDDHLVAASTIEKISRNHKNTHVQKINGAGHMLPLEQPTIVAKHLTQFFTSELTQ